jgi:hypothetical protein
MASGQRGHSGGPASRDRLLRGVRVTRWVAGLGAAGLTAAFSVAAAHAFKGHNGDTKARTPAGAAHQRVSVPAPDNVPSIAADGSLQPPQQAPQAAQPDTQQAPPAEQQQEPAAPTSGGS